MRRIIVPLVLFVSLAGSDARVAPAAAAAAAAPAPSSGALTPAPVNPTFDAPVPEATRNSPQGRNGIVEPPGWSLRRGGARPTRGDGPRGGSYALLHSGEATLESSAFTIGTSTKKLDFLYSFRAGGSRETSLRLYVLSGPSFERETLVFDRSCACQTDWTKAYVRVAQFAGESIKVRFVRGENSGSPVGVTNVATDLLQTHLGRDRASAKAGDPVNTSNGNFEESFRDLPAIPGRGVPLDFVRYYNSASTYEGSMGPKWTHTYSMGIQPEPDGTRSVRYPDGEVDNFSPAVPAVDAVTSASTTTGSVSLNHRTTADPNRVLIVAVQTVYGGTTTLSATHDGQPMTHLVTMDIPVGGAYRRYLSLFYLLNPPAGAHTIVASGMWTADLSAVAETFSNVENVAPTTVTNSGSSGAPSVTFSGATGNDVLVDFVSAASSPGMDQTLLASTAGLGSSSKPGQDAPATMSWGSSTNWLLAAVRVRGKSASAFTPPLIDAVTSGKSTAESGTASWAHTTTSASSRLLLVAVAASSSITNAANTVTYGGQQMASLGYELSYGGRYLRLFYLLNPVSGAQTVQVSTTAYGVSAIAESFSNVLNAVPSMTTAAGASGTPNVVVPGTTANDLIVDFTTVGSTPDASQTLLAAVAGSISSSAEPGQAPSVTMSWANASNWALAAVKIQGRQPGVLTPPLIDAVTSGKSTAESGAASWTHVTTSAPSRLLLVAVLAPSSIQGGSNGVKYAGQQMVELGSEVSYGGRYLRLFYLLNPVSGAQAVQVSVNSSSIFAIAETFSNVQLTVPTVTTATGGSGTPTVAVSGTTANDLVVDFTTSSTPDASQTLLAAVAGSISSSAEQGQSPSVTMSWGSTSNWVLAAVRIRGLNSAVATPAVDAVTTANTTYESGTVSWTHVTTSAPSRLLLVAVSAPSSIQGGSNGVKYAGQQMTELGSEVSYGGRYLRLFYLLNPVSGAQAVQVSVNSSSIFAIAETFSNVQLTVPTVTTATGGSGTPTVAVSGTTANDLVVDFTTSSTPDASQTLLAAVAGSISSSAEQGQSPSVMMSLKCDGCWRTRPTSSVPTCSLC